MTFAIATFNVKDLLERSDPREHARLPAKFDWIARTIRECDADVVALQEVGPAELLASVLGRLDGCGYLEPILGTPDARGIRCALVSRAPVLAARVHTAAALTFPVFCEGDPEPFGARIPLRRGIVHARVAASTIGAIDVLVAHFKSSRPVPLRSLAGADRPATTGRGRAEGTVRGSVWRTAEALFVRALVDTTLASEPGAHVVVAGDLNDVPDSMALRSLRADGAGELVDCTAHVDPASRYSTLHRGRRVQIDHVLATSDLHARLEATTFFNANLREHVPAAMGREEPLTIDSDHAPVVVRFHTRVHTS